MTGDRANHANLRMTDAAGLAATQTFTVLTTVPMSIDPGFTSVPATTAVVGTSYDAVAAGAARSLLARGANGNLWLGGAELARYQLRLNRRGQVKLEPVDEAGGGKKRGQAGHDAPPDRAGRPHELRDILWLEVRTPRSPLLAGDPRTP